MSARAIALSVLLALVGTGAPSAAQSSLTKVKLKSGHTLEGIVLDELPGGGVKLVLVQGGTREIRGEEIASIERPGAKPAAPPSAAPVPSAPPEPPAPPANEDPAAAPASTPDAAAATSARGEPGESCQARVDCAEGLRCIDKVCRDPLEGSACESRRDCGPRLGCFDNVCRTAEAATETAAAESRMEDEPAPSHRAERLDGWYGGAMAGGAVAPAFPGVAGVGGGTAFAGIRAGIVDFRLGFGGFGAAFPYGSMGVAVIRPEVFLFVAGPYGFGASFGPAVGYMQDYYGEGIIGGGLASATPVALRFEAGEAMLEPSLSAGAIFGTREAVDGVFARPFGLLALAAYSK